MYLYDVFSLWDALATKLDADAVVAGEGGGEVDAECAVGVLDNVDVDLGAGRAADTTRHLAGAGLAGVHGDHRLLVNRDGLLHAICTAITLDLSIGS